MHKKAKKQKGKYAHIPSAVRTLQKVRPDILSVPICHTFFPSTIVLLVKNPAHIYLKAIRFFFF